MENKKNNIIICVCLALIIIIFVVGAIILGNKNKNQNINDKEDNSPKPNEVIKEVVTEESILELAKNPSLHINTEINKNLLISAYSTDDIDIEISLVYDNGLYLVDNNNHKVKVNNFDEKVVTIIDADSNCALEDIAVLILTTEGNLYTITHSEGMRRFNESFYLSFKDLTNYNLKLKKLNNIPVLAITNITDDSRGNTCSFGRRAVYANDNNYYYYDTFEKIDNYIEIQIEPTPCFMVAETYCGLLVYHDQTISIDGENLIKDNDGNNIHYKEHYIDKDENIYLVSQNNDLMIYAFKDVSDYIYNGSYDITIKKLKDIKKENNKVIFTLTDNTNIEIELGE